MKKRVALLTEEVENDLDELYDYVSEFGSPEKADRLMDRILALADQLAVGAERGSVQRELRAVGVREYRQVMLGPYRLIYRTFEERVVIYVIADGRRDFQTLLAHRLLRG